MYDIFTKFGKTRAVILAWNMSSTKQPRREPQRGPPARETIIAGLYHNLIPYVPRSKGVDREKRGAGGPLTIRLGVRKKPSGTPFSVFLSDSGAPKRRGARENFPPFHPSRRACQQSSRWLPGGCLYSPSTFSSWYCCNCEWTLAVRLWEVSVSNRTSLLDPFVWLTSKMTQPQGTFVLLYVCRFCPCCIYREGGGVDPLCKMADPLT